jgi:hypothetical protein
MSMFIRDLAKVFAHIEWTIRTQTSISEDEVERQMSELYHAGGSDPIDGPSTVYVASTEPGAPVYEYWIEREGKIHCEEAIDFADGFED